MKIASYQNCGIEEPMLKCRIAFYTPNYNIDDSYPLYTYSSIYTMNKLFNELTNQEFELITIRKDKDITIAMQKPGTTTTREITVESVSEDDFDQFNSLIKALTEALENDAIKDTTVYSDNTMLRIKIGGHDDTIKP